MFNKKKKPSVKIPSKVLKKEAKKIAKKMLDTEKKKEKQKLLKEKAKVKASKKLEQKKVNEKNWEDFFNEHLQREFLGGLWITIGIILFAIFFSSAVFSTKITSFLQFLFGQGFWLLSFFSIGFGSILLIKKNIY